MVALLEAMAITHPLELSRVIPLETCRTVLLSCLIRTWFCRGVLDGKLSLLHSHHQWFLLPFVYGWHSDKIGQCFITLSSTRNWELNWNEDWRKRHVQFWGSDFTSKVSSQSSNSPDLVLHRYVRSPFLEGSKFVLLQEGGFILLQLRDQNCDISLGVNLKVEHEVLPEKF